MLGLTYGITAAFLVADAWTNVLSTTGPAELAAGGMAVIEPSLSALSLWIATRAAIEDRPVPND